MLLADSIARAIIAKVTPAREGPAYELAVLAGREYWQGVLAGSPDELARLKSQEALGELIQHDVELQGWKTEESIGNRLGIYLGKYLDRIWRAIRR